MADDSGGSAWDGNIPRGSNETIPYEVESHTASEEEDDTSMQHLDEEALLGALSAANTSAAAVPTPMQLYAAAGGAANVSIQHHTSSGIEKGQASDDAESSEASAVSEELLPEGPKPKDESASSIQQLEHLGFAPPEMTGEMASYLDESVHLKDHYERASIPRSEDEQERAVNIFGPAVTNFFQSDTPKQNVEIPADPEDIKR